MISGPTVSCVQPAAAAAAGVAHWLPPEVSIGDVNIGDIFHSGGSGPTPPLPESTPTEVLQQHQHFSALLAVADKHFVGCESVAEVLRTLEAGTATCEQSAHGHGWSFDGPRTTRGSGKDAQQRGSHQMGAGGGIQELERETCRAVLADLQGCEYLQCVWMEATSVLD